MFTFSAFFLSTEYVPTWSPHYTSMPSTCPLLYHHVQNKRMWHGLAWEMATREKIRMIKESHCIHRGMWKTASNSKTCQQNQPVMPVESTVFTSVYCHGTYILGFMKPSSTSNLKFYTLKFFQNVPANSKILKQSTLKHAFNSAFAKQW